jgi:glucuronate isomerase
MELKRPFGVTDLLSERTARTIFDRCNELLRTPEFSTQGWLRQFGVALVCTTNDPADSLDDHHALAQRIDPETRVVPTWRPDAALAIEDAASFNDWIARLQAAAEMPITRFRRFARSARPASRCISRSRLPRIGSRPRADLRG